MFALARPLSPNAWSFVNYIELAVYCVGIMGFAIRIITGKALHFPKMLHVVALGMIVMGLNSAYQAQKHFGQSFIDGLITERNSLILPLALYGFVPLFIAGKNRPRTHYLNSSAVLKSIVLAAWCTILLDTLFALTGRGFTGFTRGPGGFEVIGTQTKVLAFLPFAAVCATGAKCIWKPSIISVALLVSLIAYYLFIEVSTIQQLTFIGAIVLMAAKAALERNRLWIALCISSLALVGTVVAFNEWTELWSSMQSGGLGDDISANIRFKELAYILPDMHKYWITGAGKVSTRAMGGMSEQLELWFFPADIGIVGAVYVYGLFALFPVILQSHFALIAHKTMKTSGTGNTVTTALWAFSILSLIRTALLGETAFYEGAFIVQALAVMSLFSMRKSQTESL